MLVLRRACGESVTIGKNAETIVKVLGCKNGTVSLGFNADKDVQVDRLEIFENASRFTSRRYHSIKAPQKIK